MLTFLAAMMAVFFDGTNSATRIAISSVLLVLLVMIALLLYLERDNTVSGDSGSPYMRLFRFFSDMIRSWRDRGEEQKAVWRRILRRRQESAESIAGTSDTSSTYARSVSP